jgi:hypothetical protein
MSTTEAAGNLPANGAYTPRQRYRKMDPTRAYMPMLTWIPNRESTVAA